MWQNGASEFDASRRSVLRRHVLRKTHERHGRMLRRRGLAPP